MATTTPLVCTKSFKLNNGLSIPAVGLGTWQGSPGTSSESALKAAVVHALHSGYRHLDTAQAYDVEGVVGAAVRDSGIPRSEIWVTTKFWGDAHEDPAAALQKSLDALGLGYVDLFLMHWPMALTADGKDVGPKGKPTVAETWRKMEALVGEKCRAIGVSNFSQKTLEELLQGAKTVPAVNQVELHALNPNLKLVPWCEEKGIHVTSWSTLGGPANSSAGNQNDILTHDIFTTIAQNHGVSAGVVSLSWAVQRGVSVIPKSGNHKRIEENIRLVTLTEEEMERMNAAHKEIGQLRLADAAPFQSKNEQGKLMLMGWTLEDMGWEDARGNWLL